MTVVQADLHKLAADLTDAGVRVAIAARAVVVKGALNVQNDARATVSGHKRLQQYPQSITFDVTSERDSIRAEIGPDKDLPQGPLGNIIEYGTVNNAPMPHLEPALEREAPRFEEHLGDIAARKML